MLLNEDSLPILIYPPAPITVSPNVFPRHLQGGHEEAEAVEEGEGEEVVKPSRTVSISARNLVFKPNTASVRLHFAGAKDPARDVFLFENQQLNFVEVLGSLPRNDAAVDGEDQGQAAANEEFLEGYKVQFELPEYEALVRKWNSGLTSPEGIVAPLSSIFVSLSLDGNKIPVEANRGKISFYGDLAKYTVSTPPAKGGFNAGTILTLVMEHPCPSMSVQVRLRGSDETKAKIVPGEITENGSGGGATITFTLPDSASIVANPPIAQGKEKFYFADISADQGQSFERAANPLIAINK